MTGGASRIALKVDISRVIEVLASQIYQSPLALLRENTQNAFDAILERTDVPGFQPRIDIAITPTEIRVQDNGVGMTKQELEDHFWKPGASSKNTEEARRAGVVGTFGIGAMANFGIATSLVVETESARESQRTRTKADRDSLSTEEECIELTPLEARGEPGTQVVATIDPETPVNVQEAVNYIKDFVRNLPVPVYINDELVSQQPLSDLVQTPPATWSATDRIEIGPNAEGSVEVRASADGQLSIDLTELEYEGEPSGGRILLRQGMSQIRTFRSGFGLATVTVSSAYSFGGVADLLLLTPTAGREALSVGSMNLLQTMVNAMESWASEQFGNRPETDQNVQFVEWVRRNGRYELCGALTLGVEPGKKRMTLSEIRDRTAEAPLPIYAGTDGEVIRAHSTPDRPLLISSLRNPRKACEQQYLRKYCNVKAVSEGPLREEQYDLSSASTSRLALIHRLADILERDYFLPTSIELWRISHSVPLLADGPTAKAPVKIYLDPGGASFQILERLYETEYSAYISYAKDFVRSTIFPKVERYAPSSTRQGAEAFLRTIRTKPELMEYERSDSQELTAIWEEFRRGHLTLVEAAQRSRVAVRGNVQVVRSQAAVGDIAPDLLENQESLEAPADSDVLLPSPAITRPEVQTDASLLTIAATDESLMGYRYFLAVADRIRTEKGDYFQQPHRTTIVWGGQKVMFCFVHHSEAFGLYYDIHCDQTVTPHSGGGDYPTCTLVLGNRIYIPIPDEIAEAFVPPEQGTKRLEVRADILHIGGISSRLDPMESGAA